MPACSGPTPRKAPSALTSAIRHNDRGVDASQRQMPAVALAEFDRAYREYAAVENFPGMVTVLLNRSRTLRRLGDGPGAAAAIDRAAGIVGHTPGLAPEFWLECARVRLMLSDPEGAAEAAGNALQLASADDRGLYLNLVADICRQRQQLDRAADLANEALRDNRRRGDRREEAHSQRILADIAFARGDFIAAEARYRDALVIDKELAVSRTIHADLRGIAFSLHRQGKAADGAGYLLRAADITAAAGDSAGAADEYSAAAAMDEQGGNPARGATTRKRIERIRAEQSVLKEKQP
jgi:tetratricopeptide (TPR) repeat protein